MPEAPKLPLGSTAPYTIRPATGFDERFLWEMLYDAIYVPPHTRPPAKGILRHPGVARYLAGWGRPGDLGFIAAEKQAGQAVGAVWIRLWTERDHGYGFVDTETPELIVAVSKDHRGEGIGTLLLKRLIEEAGSRFRALSLSVSPRNRAMRLYERLGFEVVAVEQASLTMVLKLGERKLPNVQT